MRKDFQTHSIVCSPLTADRQFQPPYEEDSMDAAGEDMIIDVTGGRQRIQKFRQLYLNHPVEKRGRLIYAPLQAK